MNAPVGFNPFSQQREQMAGQGGGQAQNQHCRGGGDSGRSWNAEDIGGADSGGGNQDIQDAPASQGSVPPGSNPPASSASNQGTTVVSNQGNPAVPAQGTPTASGADSASTPAQGSSSASGQNSASGDYGTAPDGYGSNWNTVKYSNTTSEPINMQVTVGAGQSLPDGVDSNGQVTIPPGGSVDLTYAPGTSANFKSTQGDGSVWNQGELYFDGASQKAWGNMSYIYGANSNMRILSENGQHSGYLGDITDNAPADAKVGDWGIMAPFDRFNPSDDPNNPNSAAGGPDGAKNAGSAYLYDILEKGEGYVGRGKPVEVSEYDDASSLQFGGNLAVVF